MKKPILIATIGIPGSGKTTYIKTLIATGLVESVRGHICPDDIREELTGDMSNQSKNEDVFKLTKQRLQEAVAAAKKDGGVVFYDATCYNEKNRSIVREVIDEFSLKPHVDYEWHYLNVPFNECAERNEQRDRVVPKAVLGRMWYGMTLPYDGLVFVYRTSTIQAKEKAIIVDIDGTCAHNNGHRSVYDATKVYNDSVVEHVQDTVFGLACAGYKIIFVTGRQCATDGNWQCHDDTVRWINHKFCNSKNFIFHEIAADVRHEYKLFMRGPDDKRCDTIVKRELYETVIKPKYDVVLCLEDRTRVVNMWRKLGLNCFQVAEGDF